MGKDFIQGINSITIYAEKIYKINFTQSNKTFVLSLHYNGDNSYLFVNGSQELQFNSTINYLHRNLLMFRQYFIRLDTNKFNKNRIIRKCLRICCRLCSFKCCKDYL